MPVVEIRSFHIDGGSGEYSAVSIFGLKIAISEDGAVIFGECHDYANIHSCPPNPLGTIVFLNCHFCTSPPTSFSPSFLDQSHKYFQPLQISVMPETTPCRVIGECDLPTRNTMYLKTD